MDSVALTFRRGDQQEAWRKELLGAKGGRPQKAFVDGLRFGGARPRELLRQLQPPLTSLTYFSPDSIWLNIRSRGVLRQEKFALLSYFPRMRAIDSRVVVPSGV